MNRTIVCALAWLPFISIGGAGEQEQSWRPAMAAVTVAGRRLGRENSSGPIRLSYEMLGVAAIGQPLEVLITVASSRPTGGLAGKVYGHDGLIVSPAGFSVHRLDPDGSAVQTLTVTPYLSGPFRFSVLVQGEVEGQIQAAQLTVPVDVGGSTAEPTAAIGLDGSDPPILTRPARNQ